MTEIGIENSVWVLRTEGALVGCYRRRSLEGWLLELDVTE